MSAGPPVSTVHPVVQHEGGSVATKSATKESVEAAHKGEIGQRLKAAGAVVGGKYYPLEVLRPNRPIFRPIFSLYSFPNHPKRVQYTGNILLGSIKRRSVLDIF